MATPPVTSTPSKQPGHGLTPAMVCRPLTPPDIASLDGDEDDGVRRRWKCSISLIPILRTIIAIISLANTIVWIDRGSLYYRDRALIFLVVWLFFILFWNTGLLLGTFWSVLGRTRIPGCPIIICQVGDWGFVLNSDEESGFSGVPQKKKKTPLAWLVDLPSGIVTIVVSAIGYHSSPWYIQQWRVPGHAMSITVGVLQIVVAFFSLLSFYGAIVFEGGVLMKKPATAYQRIRLPDDDDNNNNDSRAAGISIHA